MRPFRHIKAVGDDISAVIRSNRDSRNGTVYEVHGDALIQAMLTMLAPDDRGQAPSH